MIAKGRLLIKEILGKKYCDKQTVKEWFWKKECERKILKER